ncbi:SDR family NAD(P)-dependent oxidoreductase [Phytoactinopolyspora endophytica]|uniref:SDR family NAD(P)-dependent oxidoreductase n=1 Tax=Phytoactinopolyspora endophytica TaxID=1642495 RepID=UPI00101C30AB|nr:SDR family NAD(P)-dependent oxidoreductase [Phytoactinopolyspora endophytica]
MSGVVIVGAGPGIGQAVACRFAREGVPVTLISRTEKTAKGVAEAVHPYGVPVVPLAADSTDDIALRAALDDAAGELGPPDAVVYNAALIRPDALGDLSVAGHLDAWAVNVVGAITTAAHVLPPMARRRSGTFIVTGGMPAPKPSYMSLSLGKAGVRTFLSMLDEEYGPAGVHVATVTVDGPVARGTTPDTEDMAEHLDPDDIADHYWRLHTQPRHAWESEVIVAA